MLETIHRLDQRVKELDCITSKVIGHLVWILEELERESHPLLNIKTFQTSLELIFAMNQTPSRAYFVCGSSLIRLVAMLAALPHMQTKDVLEVLSQLVRLNKRNEQGRTLLHIAVASFHELDNHGHYSSSASSWSRSGRWCFTWWWASSYSGQVEPLVSWSLGSLAYGFWSSPESDQQERKDGRGRVDWTW